MTAYDYGNLIEIVRSDASGGVEPVLELSVEDDRDGALDAAGFEIMGEWDDSQGVPAASVRVKW